MRGYTLGSPETTNKTGYVALLVYTKNGNKSARKWNYQWQDYGALT